MTAPHIVDPSGLLGEALAEASPDLMRSLLQDVINSLLSADADAVAGAEYGRPSAGRSAQRNGYRHRDLDTRVGTLDVADPYFGSRADFEETYRTVVRANLGLIAHLRGVLEVRR